MRRSLETGLKATKYSEKSNDEAQRDVGSMKVKDSINREKSISQGILVNDVRL